MRSNLAGFGQHDTRYLAGRDGDRVLVRFQQGIASPVDSAAAVRTSTVIAG